MSDVAVSNLPDWVALFPSAQTLSEPAHTNEHQPTELPPTPPVEVALPTAALDHLSDVATTHLPDWLLV
jgi:hypothetical protein